MGSNITGCLTSCNRHDLLKKTLDSLIRVNCGGAKPDAFFICEDGGVPIPDWLRENIHYYSSNLGKVTWIQNEGRRGQIYSCDRLMSQVKTDFVFWCEDDWEFVAGGSWLVESKAILEKYPAILQVSLRGNSGWHQLIDQPPFEGFKIAMPYWRGGWGGLAFNPGLRRLSDYKKLGTYGKYTTYGTTGLGHELLLSKMMLDAGYRIADLNRIIVTHSGGDCSRANDPLDPAPKILIAVPVCHKYCYGAFESSESPSYNAATAHEGKPYGTDIHISGDNDRIAAIRDTWLKDTAKFPNVTYKLFYGEGANRAPAADEVFLDVPDDYRHLPHKTIAICKYAKENGYDLLFKADDDSFVWVDRLIHEALSGMWDYAGWMNGRVASGGPGYWLTRRAFSIVAEKASANFHWAEDVTVSNVLFHNNIQGQMLPNHRPGFSQHWFDIDNIPDGAVCIHALQPVTMRKLYERECSR